MPNLLGSGKTSPRPGSSLEGQWSGSAVIAPGFLANVSTAHAIAAPGTATFSPNLVTTFPYTVTPSSIAGSGGSGSSTLTGTTFYDGGSPLPVSAPNSGSGGGGAPSKFPWLLAGGALLAFLYLGNQKKRRRR